MSHSYYLRSRSDNKLKPKSKLKSVSLTTASPTSPTLSNTPPPPVPQSSVSPSISQLQTSIPNHRKLRRSKRRKRTFVQFNNNTDNNDNQPINQNINTKYPKLKKRKLLKKVKFIHNRKHVHSNSVSLSPSLNIFNKISISKYEIPLSLKLSSLRSKPYCCQYKFFDDYLIGIKPMLGSKQDVDEGIKVLSQELKLTRCKASTNTSKDKYIVYIKNKSLNIIGFGILHMDHCWGRINIEMFAIDYKYRGNGYASMMIYLIQFRMLYQYYNYDLFVSAANSALPFWLNDKYTFLYAHKHILEQHELLDEKNGSTKHLIWYGAPENSRQMFLNMLVKFDQSIC